MKEESFKSLLRLQGLNLTWMCIAMFLYIAGICFKNSVMTMAAIILLTCIGHNYAKLKEVCRMELEQKTSGFITDKVISIIVICLLLIQIFVLNK